VISLVVLQNSMDLLKDEVGSCSKRYTTSTADGNETIGRESGRVLDITEEADQDPTTVPVIKTEPNVSCVPLVGVTHIWYRLYPELLAHISVCPFGTNILLKKLDFE